MKQLDHRAVLIQEGDIDRHSQKEGMDRAAGYQVQAISGFNAAAANQADEPSEEIGSFPHPVSQHRSSARIAGTHVDSFNPCC